VLFPNTQIVADLRKWVLADGVFGEVIWARRLERNLRTLVLGKPIHSHAAERSVNLGNRMKIRGAHSEGKFRVASKIVSVANGTRNDWRVARSEYEDMFVADLKANNTEPSKAVHWRDKLTGAVPREHARTNKRNKAIIAAAILRFAARAKEAAADSAAAFAMAAANEAAGTDRAGVHKAAKDKTDALKEQRALKRATSRRMTQYDNSSRSALAAKSTPARVALDTIDLTHPPSKVILAAECHERGNDVASVDDTLKQLVDWLSKYHKAKNESGDRIPRMATADGRAKRKWTAAAPALVLAVPAAEATPAAEPVERNGGMGSSI